MSHPYHTWEFQHISNSSSPHPLYFAYALCGNYLNEEYLRRLLYNKTTIEAFQGVQKPHVSHIEKNPFGRPL